MSSRRDRERRELDADDLEPVVEVLPERRPTAIASARSRFVAEIRRTLTLIGSLVPTRTISPDSRTRRSLTWVESGMSPTSSRKSVPPLACSNHPLRSRSAPVKAPLTWPNSSRFQDVLAQRRAVQRDERLVPPRAVVVERLGDQLLAGARSRR